ncbi:hypothetical protein PsAD2_03413 [Pseudovibrio axinellae]|uniref:Uncharacterized protein n=1 Tax=Pseudovibrio axinellae TaxID=989403 RepID=A0A165WQS2_9HYPH|nr:hypothetical protein [Pseudovibrio axinellae]KZL16796.1 hypothetical protein PsAD2_03413 [Pseudovibrio axinellae]SER70011.1 hypothetical protein SAMN05421798_11713 [Pseudovibrio axinellae]
MTDIAINSKLSKIDSWLKSRTGWRRLDLGRMAANGHELTFGRFHYGLRHVQLKAPTVALIDDLEIPD